LRVQGELLERRLLLTVAPATGPLPAHAQDAALVDFYGPDLVGKDGPMVKIGFDLALLYEELRFHDALDPNSPFTNSNTTLDVSGQQVIVDVNAASDPAGLQSQLTAIGMNVQDASGSLLEGAIPISALNQLAALDALGFARPVYKPVTAIGSVTSQADAAMQVNAARAQFGVSGQGITVGVLSDSFNQIPYPGNVNGMARDISTGDLPQNTQILEDSSFGEDEGRAMAQLIHDLAPGAAIRFATANGGEAHFANNISALAKAGSKVIVDDVSYFTEPFFQDGLVARAVNNVFAQGIPYFSSAGNSGNHSYESAFVDSGVKLSNGSILHDFDPGPGVSTLQKLTIPVGGVFKGSFQWDQPFKSLGGAGSLSDLDISLLGSNGTTVLGSSITNNVGGDPLELLAFANDGSFDFDGNGQPDTTFFVRIELVSGPAPGLMKYVDFGQGTTITGFATQSSTDVGHHNTSGAMGVAASAFFFTPAFGAAVPILNSFSSLGGTSLLFDTNGNRLTTPFNPNSPQITGVDGTNTTFFGDDIPQDADSFPNFFGTSAAAPHVAAVAALMIEAGQGKLSPGGIYSVLENTATDIVSRTDPFSPGVPISILNGVGVDAFSGHGLVNALQAIQVVKSGILISDVSQFEGDSGTTDFVFTVSIGIGISLPVTVEYATVAGTAVAIEDYVAQSGTLTFEVGGPKSQQVTIQVIGDIKVESDETFIVRLSNVVNGFIGRADGVGTIRNDDVDLSISDATVVEGDAGTTNAVFTVSAFGSTDRSVSVDYRTIDGTAVAASDFLPRAGSLNFPPGGGTATITVPIVGDLFNESTETFSVALLSPLGGRLVKAIGIGTIVDNDPTPSLYVNDVHVTTAAPGVFSAVFTVAIDIPSGQDVTVAVSTADDTAQAGIDYVPLTAVVTFSPGVTTQQVTVGVLGDAVYAPNEKFLLNLSSPVHAQINDPRGVCTIIFADAPADERIIDDGDPGYVSTGGWVNATNTLAYQLDYSYHAGGAGANTATWTFGNLPAGQYEVFARWSAFGNRATNAPYTILDGATSRGTVLVNQTLAPAGDLSNGVTWQSLGSYQITLGSLSARLSDNANGYVIADAIRIVGSPVAPKPEMDVEGLGRSIGTGDATPSALDGRDFGTLVDQRNTVTRTFLISNTGNADLHLNGNPRVEILGANPADFTVTAQPSAVVAAGLQTNFQITFHPTGTGLRQAIVSIANDDDNEHPYTFAVQGLNADPGPSTLTIDDAGAGFSAVGSWAATNYSLAFRGQVHTAPAGQGTSTATWMFTGLTPGQYDVYATWTAGGNRASNAPFTIADGSASPTTFLVNQQQAANDLYSDGVMWEAIASPTISSGVLKVGLSDAANGLVVADAVRVVRHIAAGASAPAVVSQNLAMPLDVNGDNRVTSMDALLVIRSLLEQQGAVASQLSAAQDAPVASSGANTYLDVNGDGRVSPLDALTVISFLLKPSAPTASSMAIVASPSADSPTSSVALASVDQAFVEFDASVSDTTDPPVGSTAAPANVPTASAQSAVQPTTISQLVVPAARAAANSAVKKSMLADTADQSSVN
jgi:hypothetical protein